MAERQLIGLGKDSPAALIAYRIALADLSPDNIEAWQVFNTLHTSRPIGLAAGGIPQTEILAWFILRGREVDRYLVAKLMALDRLFLADQTKRMSKPQG